MYASGAKCWKGLRKKVALVKCRKVGAANWGNSTLKNKEDKKEEYNLEENKEKRSKVLARL